MAGRGRGRGMTISNEVEDELPPGSIRFETLPSDDLPPGSLRFETLPSSYDTPLQVQRTVPLDFDMECMVNNLEQWKESGSLDSSIRHLATEIKKCCTTEERLKQVSNILHERCLLDKGYSEMICRSVHALGSFQAENLKMRNTFLSHLQKDFKERRSLLDTSREKYINGMNLIGCVFRFTGFSDGRPIDLLAKPLLEWSREVLETATHDEQGIDSVVEQVVTSGTQLNSVAKLELFDLVGTARKILIQGTIRSPVARSALLLLVEQSAREWAPFNTVFLSYYAPALGEVYIASIKRFSTRGPPPPIPEPQTIKQAMSTINDFNSKLSSDTETSPVPETNTSPENNIIQQSGGLQQWEPAVSRHSDVGELNVRSLQVTENHKDLMQGYQGERFGPGSPHIPFQHVLQHPYSATEGQVLRPPVLQYNNTPGTQSERSSSVESAHTPKPEFANARLSISDASDSGFGATQLSESSLRDQQVANDYRYASKNIQGSENQEFHQGMYQNPAAMYGAPQQNYQNSRLQSNGGDRVPPNMQQQPMARSRSGADVMQDIGEFQVPVGKNTQNNEGAQEYGNGHSQWGVTIRPQSEMNMHRRPVDPGHNDSGVMSSPGVNRQYGTPESRPQNEFNMQGRSVDQSHNETGVMSSPNVNHEPGAPENRANHSGMVHQQLRQRNSFGDRDAADMEMRARAYFDHQSSIVLQANNVHTIQNSPQFNPNEYQSSMRQQTGSSMQNEQMATIQQIMQANLQNQQQQEEPIGPYRIPPNTGGNMPNFQTEDDMRQAGIRMFHNISNNGSTQVSHNQHVQAASQHNAGGDYPNRVANHNVNIYPQHMGDFQSPVNALPPILRKEFHDTSVPPPPMASGVPVPRQQFQRDSRGTESALTAVHQLLNYVQESPEKQDYDNGLSAEGRFQHPPKDFSAPPPMARAIRGSQTGQNGVSSNGSGTGEWPPQDMPNTLGTGGWGTVPAPGGYCPNNTGEGWN